MATSGLIEPFRDTMVDLGVTWRELGVLVVPWGVVGGMVVGMLAKALVADERREKVGDVEGLRRMEEVVVVVCEKV